MPAHMLAGSVCSHRRRILCWDSSRPSVTIITPHGDFDKAGPRFDSLTCSLHGSRAKQKFMTREAANLGNASVLERRARRRYVARIDTRRGRCINNHQLIRYSARCRFRAVRAPAAAACSATPLAWVSCFSRRN